MTHLCPFCFENKYLRQRVVDLRRNRQMPSCSYHPTRKGLPISEVAGIIDVALRTNYEFAFQSPLSPAGENLLDLLHQLTEPVNDRIVDDLSSALIDADVVDERDGDTPFYADDFQYSLVEPNGWVQSELWIDFRQSIAYENRFFNGGAKDLLGKIFENVHYLSDENKQPAFYALEPGTLMQRARAVGSLKVAREWADDPARSLGPPPKHVRNAGRMNAAGIGALYAAFDDPTCLAELRPLVGGLVCLASFRLRRPVHVLDFTRFERPGRNIDIFAKNYAARTTQWAFMQNFQQEISTPILPDDTHLEYVPTQVVAEFLTTLSIQYRGAEQRIEGLVYRSAQSPGGHNVVLFGEAGQVVGGHDAAQPSSRSDFDFSPSMPAARQPDPALEYDLESFRVRRITSADFGCDPEFLPAEGGPDF